MASARLDVYKRQLYRRLDHINGSRQGKKRQYLSILGGISAKSAENRQLEKKIQKVLVLKIGIPIMRLHRHGGCESLHS